MGSETADQSAVLQNTMVLHGILGHLSCRYHYRNVRDTVSSNKCMLRRYRSVFGIIPAVSRSLVASSTLTIQSLQVLDPSPTNFRLVLNSTLEHATNFVPTLDGFTSSLFLATNDSTNPVPFSTANIATFASGPTSPINLDQIEPITDLNAFTGFAKALVSSQEVSLDITGKSVLRLGALSALNVDFDKTVTMNGLLLFSTQCLWQILNLDW